MLWTKPEFSKGKIDKAGRLLVGNDTPQQDWVDSLLIVNNWRAAHNFPLNTFQVTLRKKAQEIDPNRLVAQRIKRMTSIEAKLARFKGMRMSQMQDIGGCRAILSSTKTVERLVQTYVESDIKHKLDRIDDYIAQPKSSGYRGTHVIYRYYSDRSGPSAFNGLFIEMQVRTKLQHTWATAVETVGTFLQQALKSSMGEELWLRFFALMSSMFAIKEKCDVLVPGTPSSMSSLVSEIIDIERKLNVRNSLTMYQQAIKVAREGPQKGNHYYLLTLEPKKLQMTVKAFKRNQLAEASLDYVQEEARIASEIGSEAVLVSVDSLSSLERAYPNYFLDTTVFLLELEKIVTSRV